MRVLSFADFLEGDVVECAGVVELNHCFVFRGAVCIDGVGAIVDIDLESAGRDDNFDIFVC